MAVCPFFTHYRQDPGFSRYCAICGGPGYTDASTECPTGGPFVSLCVFSEPYHFWFNQNLSFKHGFMAWWEEWLAVFRALLSN